MSAIRNIISISKIMMMMISIMMLLLPSSTSTSSSSFLTLSKSAVVIVAGSVGAVVAVQQQQQHDDDDNNDENRFLQMVPASAGKWDDDDDDQGLAAADKFQDCGNPYMYRHKFSNSCICKQGFRGYDCTFCESNEACNTVIPALGETERITDGVCTNEPSFQKSHYIKTYECMAHKSLPQELEVHARCNTRAKKCAVALNKSNQYHQDRPIVGPFYLECEASGCNFNDNESSVNCAAVECVCSDKCSEASKNMVASITPDTAVTLDITNEGFMDFDLPGSIIRIQAQCQIASCAYNEMIEVPGTDVTTGQTIAPTTGPTIAPTTGPTTAPTTGPTTAPTTGPTIAPTIEVTTDVTTGPTINSTT